MSEHTPAYQYIYSVHFNGNKKAYSFGTNDSHYAYDDAVVVETARGLELGSIISEARDPNEVKVFGELKPILRKATKEDEASYKRNKDESAEAMRLCEAAIKRLKLDMKLVSADFTLDRSKVIFIYVADERVDFRDLLRELAGQLHCRIELRQIGPRDKAKMIGGIGPCGQETCCSRFLNTFDVVSINMAKNQLLALNIPKLSGQCGKLMCCLKYEDEAYRDLRKGCPKLNEQIKYNGNQYRVTSINVLSKTAKLENREQVYFLPFEQAFKDWTKKEEVKGHETTEKLSE